MPKELRLDHSGGTNSEPALSNFFLIIVENRSFAPTGITECVKNGFRRKIMYAKVWIPVEESKERDGPRDGRIDVVDGRPGQRGRIGWSGGAVGEDFAKLGTEFK